jgi:hypothetical protein
MDVDRDALKPILDEVNDSDDKKRQKSEKEAEKRFDTMT